MNQIMNDSRFKEKLSALSISYESKNLYIRNPPILEEMTRENLGRKLQDLMEGSSKTIVANDKNLQNPLRLRVRFL